MGSADVFKVQMIQEKNPHPKAANESTVTSLTIELIISYILTTVGPETGWVLPNADAYLNINKIKDWWAVKGTVEVNGEMPSETQLKTQTNNDRFNKAYEDWLGVPENKKKVERQDPKKRHRKTKPKKYKEDDRVLIWIFQGCEGSLSQWLKNNCLAIL